MKILLVLLPLVIMVVKGQAPKPVYGPPKTGGSGGYTGGGDEISEPANYEFSYEVQDDKEGLNFGHMENRQGDSAKGSYHVLLPDGRTQKVDYVADQSGYMPKLTYEGDIRPDSFGPPGGSIRSGGTGVSGNTGVSLVGGTGVVVNADGGGYRY